MSSEALHGWNLNPAEAIQLQLRLREQIRIEPLTRDIRTIAGADVSFNKFSDIVYSGVVVLSLPELQIIESVSVRSAVKFPYIPGLLSFREIPSLLEAWEQLTIKPDVLMLDGQGLAHPRRFGIACHAGLLLGLPAIGCAKSILVGKYGELGLEAGSQADLIDRGEKIGVALRTKKNVAPIFVSPGHLVDLPSAIELTLKVAGKYRQPAPTREAHLLVNRVRLDDAGKR